MKTLHFDIENNSLLDAALILQKNGEQKEALRLVKIILKSDPKQIAAAVLAGLIYQSLKDSKNAELHFQQALSINSKYPNALKSWGLFLLTQDRKTEAWDILTQYLDLVKWDDQEILESLFDIASEIGSKEKGIEILKEGWEHTLNPDIGNLYCIQLRLNGDEEKALPILEILAKVSPEPSILNQLGITLQLSNKNERAIQVYRQALQRVDELKDEEDLVHDKESVETPSENLKRAPLCESCQLVVYLWDNLSDCYLASGQAEAALEAAEHALRLDPHLDHSLQKKVNALLSLERYGEAEQYANEYMDRHVINDPDLRTFFELIVDGFAGGQQNELAIEYLKRAITKFPKEESFYYNLADLLEEMGNLGEAAGVLKNAFNILPEADSLEFDNLEKKVLYRLNLYILLDHIGQGKTAWEYLRNYFDRNSEELNSMMADAIISELWVENEKEYQPMVHLIEQLYGHSPDHPLAVYLMSTLCLSRNEFKDGVTLLEKIHTLQVTDVLRQVLLNNLGFGYLMQRKLELVEEVLEEALDVNNADTYRPNGKIFGVAFYMDGAFYTINQVWESQTASIIYPGLYDSFSIVAILKCNLIALALARGDADQASALLAENLVTSHDYSEGYWRLNHFSLLSLARFRNDRKTAQFAWKKILEKYEVLKTDNGYEELTEERLINLFPRVNTWLFSEA